MNEMQHILSTVRQAVDKYGMIEENDTVVVGLSGGKDSIALLASLDRLKNFYPKNSPLSESRSTWALTTRKTYMRLLESFAPNMRYRTI